MPRLNKKKLLYIGGGVAVALVGFNWLARRNAAQAAEIKKAEDVAKAAKASGSDTQSIVQQVLATPAVQEKVAELGTKATGFVSSLLSKIGIGG